jgi:hypothetical protein
MVNFNARLCLDTLDTYLLKVGVTNASVVKEAKSTKRVTAHLPQKPGAADAPERLPADCGIAPIAGRTHKKYLRMILWAGLSAVFLGGGSIAGGLLSDEESATRAVLLFLAALAGAAGCIFFFYCFLREISPKPKGPFISTLQ